VFIKQFLVFTIVLYANNHIYFEDLKVVDYFAIIYFKILIIVQFLRVITIL